MTKSKKYQQGGYKSDSKDLYNPYNIITSPNITMQGVKMPVFAIDSSGNEKYMEPGKDYKFPGNFVTEFPVRKQDGGPINNQDQDPTAWLNQGENTPVDLQQRKRPYHGRHQNKPDRSLYEPHPAITRYLNGGQQPRSYQDTLAMANSSNPQYQEYGNMFSVDGTSGLYERPDTSWQGFGNSANLISNQKSPYNPAGVSSTGYQPIQRQQAQTQQSNWHTNDNTDYSIDSVRSQYQQGGFNPNQGAVIDNTPPQGISQAQVMPFEGRHLVATSDMTDWQKQVRDIQARQDNTPAIGATPTWQQKIQNSSLKHYLPEGAMQEVVGTAGDMLTYPVKAIANLSQPSKYFQGAQSDQDNFMAVGQMLMDIDAAYAPFSGIRGKVPQPVAEPPMPYSGGFPINTIKTAKGTTDMPWLTEGPQPLTKTQQILQSHGLDPYKTRVPDQIDIPKNPDEFDWSVPISKWPKPKDKIGLDDMPELNPIRKKEEIDYEDNTLGHISNLYERGLERSRDINRNTINPMSSSPKPMIMVPNPIGKGEVFEQGYEKPLQELDSNSPFDGWNPSNKLKNKLLDEQYPYQYTDFGLKTPMQKMFEDKGNFAPDNLRPTERQKNQYGGIIKNNWLDKYK